MCQICVDAVKRHYPDVPDEEYGRFLMGTTCYPFGDGRLVEEQLVTAKRNTDGSIQAAYEYADMVMSCAMAGFDPIGMGM